MGSDEILPHSCLTMCYEVNLGTSILSLEKELGELKNV